MFLLMLQRKAMAQSKRPQNRHVIGCKEILDIGIVVGNSSHFDNILASASSEVKAQSGHGHFRVNY